jgi:CelD/BcsL family acetyltransferase involved in cellulose biosynthesis
MRDYVFSRTMAAAAPCLVGALDQPMEEELHAGAGAVADEWEALAERTGASPFLRPGWIRIWHKHFAATPLHVLTVRRAGRVVALVPFIRSRGRLRTPTNFHTPEFGVLAEDSHAARVLFRQLFAQPHRRISLGLIHQDGRDAIETLAAAASRRERTLIRRQQQSPYLDLRGTSWRACEGALTAKLRSDLRRRARKLGELGPVTFQVADGRERLHPLLLEGFSVEPSGWKARRGTAITSRCDTQLFYVDVAEWAARRGSLRLAFLRLAGRPLAFQFGIEESGVYYFLKGGYDVGFRQFAPGKLLVRHMLARAFDAGLERFEFLGTSESWKSEWTTTCRQRIEVSAFARGPLGQMDWLAHRFGRPIVKRVLTTVGRWRRSAAAGSPDASCGTEGWGRSDAHQATRAVPGATAAARG